jgi:hypothetical protein
MGKKLEKALAKAVLPFRPMVEVWNWLMFSMVFLYLR